MLFLERNPKIIGDKADPKLPNEVTTPFPIALDLAGYNSTK